MKENVQMLERTRSRVSHAIAAALLVAVITAVCDTIDVENPGMSDVDRFLKAIEAVENGASIKVLDEVIGVSKQPWTIIFLDEGPAHWDEYFREPGSDTGFHGTGSVAIGAFGLPGAGMLGMGALGVRPSRQDEHEEPTCEWEHGDSEEETRPCRVDGHRHAVSDSPYRTPQRRLPRLGP